ncbi:MAG: hypothetical protein GX442_20325 [Candidatus Riflebacteria bacterium]|nr:hypothetical protein [Candidatus Riflebacteria bacterium]
MASLVLAILLAVVHRVIQAVVFQGAAQDRSTTAWMVTGQALSTLRHDLEQAKEVRVIGTQRLDLKLVTMTPALTLAESEVTWQQAGPTTLTRTEGGNTRRFDFAGALARGETVTLKLAGVSPP